MEHNQTFLVHFFGANLVMGLIARVREPTTHREWDELSASLHGLEEIRDLSVGVMLATNIRRLLEEILELDTIPADVEWEYEFGARAKALLFKWNRRLVQEAIVLFGPTTN
ncbi:hypothetical protein QBC45DRAFT_397728 [Copromyces sp. CBS 386.78]|nr:hypothetical protein QBC45DRAFT_397728 [Copromyces sp. CBS 386.78]